MKSPSPPKKSRSLLQLSAFLTFPYTLHTFGVMLAFMGLYFPLFYIQSFALKTLTINEDLAFYLLAILNAGSVFGRVVPNFVADKIGPLNMLVPCTVFSGILCLCWIRVRDLVGAIVFCVLYGFFSGAFVSLIPAVIAKLTPDLSNIGTWMGMSLSIGAIGLLVGNPIAGALIREYNGSFIGAQCFCGIIILLGAFLIGMARQQKAKSTEDWKV